MTPRTGQRVGRPGQRWVDNNYALKNRLRERNGGQMPWTPAFTSTSFPGSDQWSENNPPDILFFLEVPKSPYADLGPPGPWLDASGRPYLRADGTVKRAFEILPDRISIDVPGWLLETWRRIDPRIGFGDIIDRMSTDLGRFAMGTIDIVVLPSKNGLSNHCRRNCRALINHYSNYGRREESHRAEVEALTNLSMYNITHNTVLNNSGFSGRPTKVRFVRQVTGGLLTVEPLTVTAGNYLQATFASDHFTVAFPGQTFTLTSPMIMGITLLFQLQERAVIHNLDPDNWSKLHRDCLPDSWFDRTRNKTANNGTANNNYLNGGCDKCTWVIREREIAQQAANDRITDVTDTAESSEIDDDLSEEEETLTNFPYGTNESQQSEGVEYEFSMVSHAHVDGNSVGLGPRSGIFSNDMDQYLPPITSYHVADDVQRRNMSRTIPRLPSLPPLDDGHAWLANEFSYPDDATHDSSVRVGNHTNQASGYVDASLIDPAILHQQQDNLGLVADSAPTGYHNQNLNTCTGSGILYNSSGFIRSPDHFEPDDFHPLKNEGALRSPNELELYNPLAAVAAFNNQVEHEHDAEQRLGTTDMPEDTAMDQLTSAMPWTEEDYAHEADLLTATPEEYAVQTANSSPDKKSEASAFSTKRAVIEVDEDLAEEEPMPKRNCVAGNLKPFDNDSDQFNELYATLNYSPEK